MFFLFALQSNAQIRIENVNFKHLKVEDGLAMSRVDDMICDKQNILWIKTSRGLQFWDGQHIQTFQDSVIDVGTYFHIYPHAKDGVLISMPGLIRQFTFEGLQKKLIYSSNVQKKTFLPIPLDSKKSDVVLIHPDTLYYPSRNGIDQKVYVKKQTSSYNSNIHQYITKEGNFIVDFISHNSFQNFNKSFEEIVSSLASDQFRNTIVINPKHIVISHKLGLTIFKSSTETFIPYPDQQKVNYYSALLEINDQKILVGLDNMLYEYNVSNNTWLKTYKNFAQKDLLQTGYYDKLLTDSYGNIWAITVNEGLLKIYNNETFKYFGTGDKKLNFVKNIIADEKENRIITSALNGGIIVYDTLGNQLHKLNSSNTNGFVNSVTGIYKINDNKYIFNNHNDSLIYILSLQNNRAIVKPISTKKETYLYYQDAIKYDDNTSYLLFNTLYKLIHSTFQLTPIFRYISTKSCMIQDGEYLWIGCIDGVLKHRIGDSDNYKFISLPNEGYIRSIASWKDDKLAIGSDKGLSLFDKQTERITKIEEGCVYCLLADSDYNIWAGTGEGLIKMDSTFHRSTFTLKDGIQNNEFNTNACVSSTSGKMYFGGINGITSFEPRNINLKNSSPSFYIKSLLVGNEELIVNSNIQQLEDYNLNYDQNNLSISVGSIGKFESDSYNYQYYVEGVSSKWIDVKQQTNYNFSLTPGKYKFYFLSSSTFDPNAVLKNPLVIDIKNPWWKQWWFYLLFALSMIGILVYVIKAKEKQKYLKEKFEWDLEHQRQEDRINLSKELHDNIGSRLTFLVSSIENIKKAFGKNSTQAIEKIDDLTDFGKDTIEDLRSMMWVLTQQTISIQDLQLKILDYLNIAQNTYKNIDFQYVGPSDHLDHKLESKLSQNIFRVIQEAIHNSIKHADPSKVKIEMSFLNEKIKISIQDNGKGFDTKKNSTGHGIQNMKSRLMDHQSILSINSNHKSGTILQFELDINKQII